MVRCVCQCKSLGRCSTFTIFQGIKIEKPLSAMDKEADKTIVHPEVLSQSKIPY